MRSLAVCERLDVEAKRRADALDVFAIEFLQDCRLACIVQTTSRDLCYHRILRLRKARGSFSIQKEDTHLLLLLSILSDDGEKAHREVVVVVVVVGVRVGIGGGELIRKRT